MWPPQRKQTAQPFHRRFGRRSENSMNAKRSVLKKRGLSLVFMNCPRLFGFLPLLTKVVTVAAMLFLAVPAHAAISYVGAGATASSTGSNNRSLVVPTIVNDDLLIAHVAIRGNRTITPPAGWTLIDQVYVSNARITQGIYYKVGLASDSGTTVTWNFSNSDDNAGVIRAYRGVDTTTPIGNFSGNINGGNSSATLTALSITTTIANEWIATFYAVADGAANPVTTPGGMAERYDFDNGGGGNGLSLAGDDEARPTAGATGNRVSTSSQSDRYVAQLVALKPISLPAVISIGLASSDPTSPATVVSWTVDFNTSVTGVNTADFALVQGGGVTGAAITSVTGSGTSWTVTANTGSGTGTLGLDLVDNDSIIDAGSVPLGGAGAGNGDFTGQVYTVSPPFCTPPSNIPAGVTVSCVCDTFGRASLNPSTIYGSNWIVSTSDGTGIVPSIVNPGYLRLTDRTANNAKAATVPGIFPAAGNYISVEFQHYAYNSANSGNIGNCASNTGADGIAVTLSDYSVTAVPGAFGGSLGYAQHTNPSNVVGFAGGWVGIALDEWGNFQNPTEGRNGGPGPRCESVGVRGSGSGMTGYPWVGGSATLTPRIDNYTSTAPSPGYYYQVIVDARNAGNPTPETFVSVGRDTSGTGTAYSTLVAPFDVFAANAGQAVVPSNWQISFTGSTGGSNNIHEIGGLRICAQTVAPPSGGTASGFNAIDEAYGTPPSGPAVQSFLNGHIYMKVMGLSFKLNVAALSNNQIVTTYAAGGNKNVAVKLVNNSDGVCILDSTQANYCNAACTGKTAVAGGSQTLTFVSGDSGKKLSANFTLNTAYKNLVAVMSDGTTTACSTDAFSVRPASIDSVTSSPALIAAGAAFSLTATTTGIPANPSGYTGVLKINTSAVQVPSGAVTGTLAPTSFPAATSGTPSSTATGNTFTYSEVGTFNFLGYAPGSDATSPRGVYDGVATATECASPVTPAQCDILRAATWMGIDSITSKGDCVQNNYSNTKDVNGKYGCSFGIVANTGTIGRFTPAYFDVTKIDGCAGGGAFTYSGQPLSQVQVKAKAVGGTDTKNYDGVTLGFAKAVDLSDGNSATAGSFGNGTFAAAGFANGAQTKTNVSYTFTAKETPSLTLKLRATEAPGGDGVSSNYAGATEDNAKILSGRINVYNAYGSELVDLYVPMQAEYYEDTTVT
jgi:MSHA biogenesis protein MshQ